MAERFGHPDARAFAHYLTGLLEADDEQGFEQHIAGCPSCADRLTHEAALDMLLHEAAEPARVVRLPMAERVARVACAIMAAAAAVLLVLADPTQYLELDAFESLTGVDDEVMLLAEADTVCMPEDDGIVDVCDDEDPMTVALATIPGPPGPEPSVFDALDSNECNLDAPAINPLCVTSDPVAG